MRSIKKTNKNDVLIAFILGIASVSAKAQNVTETLADSVQLKEVIVTQRLVRHEAGKDIVNTLTLRKGKTNLVELLGDIPGLLVNESDESIHIQGKGSIKIMLNGRLKNISSDDIYNFLRSRPASNVTAVEIVKVPGAKYDASGNYGILNIITERRQDYLGGDIGEEFSYGKKGSNNARASLNYSHKRTEANLTGSWNLRNDRIREKSESFFTDMSRVSSMTNSIHNRDYRLSGMMDYHIDSLSVFSFDVSYSNDCRKSNAVIDFYSLGDVVTILENGQTLSNTRTPRRNLNMSFYIDRNWSEDKSIKFNLDIFNYKYTNNYNYNSLILHAMENTQTTDDLVNHGFSHLRGLSGALDYTTLLSWDINLSVGLKAHVTSTKNDLSYELSTIPQQNGKFIYDEDVYAAYLTTDKKVGNYTFHLGGRYEQTYTKNKYTSTNSNNYRRFFPDVIISYRFKSGSSLEVSVNSGTERPGIRHINPFVFYINPYSITLGNPTIKPDNWWNVRLTHNWCFDGGELTTDLTYLWDNGAFDQTTKMDNETTIATTQWNNAQDERSFILDMSFYYSKVKWLKIISGLEWSVNKSRSKMEYLNVNTRDVEQMYYCNLRFILDPQNTWSAYINSSFNGKQKNAVGTVDPVFNLNCGVNCSLLKNKLDLKLFVRNLFASKISGTSCSNDNMHMTFSNRYNNLTVGIGISYSFGHDLRIKHKEHSSAEIESRFE